MPQNPVDVRSAATFLTDLADQNGCRIGVSVNKDVDLKYVALKSEGITCQRDGSASSGRGTLTLERSDGARIAQLDGVYVADGIAFNKEVARAQLAATDGEKTLWLALKSDAAMHAHYLLRAQAPIYNRFGVMQVEPQVDIVTDRNDDFRRADAIAISIQRALDALLESTMPYAHTAELVFSENFTDGTITENDQKLLYKIYASRRHDWRTSRGVGEWKYNIQNATNYVFRREAQEAERKRMLAQQEAQRARMQAEQEAQRKRIAALQAAREESEKLRRYNELVELVAKEPSALLVRLQSDVRYEPITGGTYARMAGGDARNVRLIVEITDTKDQDAVADFPYRLHVVGQRELKKGWYIVGGTASLDGKRLDKQDLPLTLITPTPGAIHPCAKAGCADMRDPLTATRFLVGAPEWTPEQAQAAIDRAQTH